MCPHGGKRQTGNFRRTGTAYCPRSVFLSAGSYGRYQSHDGGTYQRYRYLFDKSLELIEAGINVVLDWGFWMKEERDYAREFYNGRNIECEFHYIDISDETWKARLMKRNSAILAEETSAYYVDDNLAAKFGALFEKPSRDEIDVWVEQ